jgi:hypothetical protein
VPLAAIGISTSYTYTQFSFKPSGGTDLPDPSIPYYITVARDNMGPNQPIKNFYTIQIDPLNSKVVDIRP